MKIVIQIEGQPDYTLYEFDETDKKIVEAIVPSFSNWAINSTDYIPNKHKNCVDKVLSDFKDLIPDTVTLRDLNDNKKAVCQLIFADPRYKDRATRDAEATAALAAQNPEG